MPVQRQQHPNDGVGVARPTGLMQPFKISDELKAIIGVPTANRTEIIKLIWRYVIANKLQDPRDKRFFFPDDKMQRVFGEHRMRVHATMKFIKPYLIPFQQYNPMLQQHQGNAAQVPNIVQPANAQPAAQPQAQAAVQPNANVAGAPGQGNINQAAPDAAQPQADQQQNAR